MDNGAGNYYPLFKMVNKSGSVGDRVGRITAALLSFQTYLETTGRFEESRMKATRDFLCNRARVDSNLVNLGAILPQ